MTKYIVRAVIGVVPTLLVLIFLVSLMVRLVPGSAVDVMLTDSGASRSQRAELEHQLGLDRSVVSQYFDYLRAITDGSFGHSLFNHQSVISQINRRVLPSVELSLFSLVVSWSVGIFVGMASAIRRNSVLDYGLRIFVNGFLGIPNFVIATVIVVLPAFYF